MNVCTQLAAENAVTAQKISTTEEGDAKYKIVENTLPLVYGVKCRVVNQCSRFLFFSCV